MASRKEYEMLFSLNAKMGSSFSGTFKSAQSTIASMQKEIQALSQTQGDIAAYQKQQQAVEATRQKLSMLQQQYDNIQREIQETEGFSSSLENKLLSKQAQIDKTSAALSEYTARLNQTGAALNEAGIDTNNLQAESARLANEIGDLKEKQVEAAEGAKSFGDKSVEAIEATAAALAAAGIAKAFDEIYQGYMKTVEAAGNFEEAMSNVEALSGANAEELGQLSDMAKELGATTKFTAKESADAMGYMSMAGWDAEQMLAGMPGVLQLAAASGEDLAMVSDIVTDSLSAFGLTAADSAHFSDVLAAAATSSNTNVSIMGETFKNSASIAGALGYSIEDVAVAVGLMANSGIKGSVAGTALKNTFNGLLEGVTLTSAAFGEYEFSAVQADGTIKDFSSTIDELRGYFSQMTDAEKVANAQAIAGQRGYNGLIAILNATGEDYANLTAKINNCTGAAQKMADIKLDNMNGELTIMESAWDGLTIAVGENFTPIMRELYGVFGDVFGYLTDFVQQNPALVKAVAAFVAVLGVATTGLTAYAAIVKVVKLLDMATIFTGPVGAILAGVTAVAALTAAVVGLVSSADSAVPSVKELTEAARGLDESLDSANTTLEESMASTMATANVADMYISKLEELNEGTDASNEHSKTYLNTLQLLVNAMPELADSIDLETGAIEGGTDALREQTKAWEENAKAKAYQEYMNTVMAEYNDVMTEAAANEIKLTEAQIKSENATKGMKDTYQEILDVLGLTEKEFTWMYGSVYDLAPATDQLRELRDQYIQYSEDASDANATQRNLTEAIEEDAEAVAEAQAAYESAQAAIDQLTGSTDAFAESENEAAAQAAAVGQELSNAAEQMAPLIEAYNNAYQAAYDSINGQYELWDKASEVVATSAESINAAMESQITYWQDYNSNLQALNERAADIDGLSEVISSFADGSEESVNAIAGMASASDEDLAAMVENWRNLQAEQETTSASLADLETGFSENMSAIAEDVSAAVADMNVSSDATAAAQATIQAYIDQANSMLPQVQAAYKSIADAASSALGSTSVGGSSGGKSSGRGSVRAYAGGTESAEPGFAVVGEEGPELIYFNGGERVLDASETAAMQENMAASPDAMNGTEYTAIMPQAVAAMAAYGSNDAIDAVDGGATYGGSEILFQPVYNISGVSDAQGIEAVLQRQDADLRDYILDVVNEADTDNRRGRYS